MAFSASAEGQRERAYDQACVCETNCGRIETRHIETIPITAESCGFPYAAQAGRVTTTVSRVGQEFGSEHSQLLITSVEQEQMSAIEMLECRRSYWGVEAGLHAPLDVSALEDKSRVRLRNNCMVLAVMRRAAVSLSNAWKTTAPIRRANLPGFFEAVGRDAVELLTRPPPRVLANLKT